jgi:hypothetical protein
MIVSSAASTGSDHGRDAALEVEAQRDVEQDADEAEEDGVDGLPLQLLADLRPHELDPADLRFAEATLLHQRLLDLLRELLRGGGGQRRPDDEFVRAPELLDDRFAHTDTAQGLADVADRRRLLEAHLHQGAAREVDVVAQALRGQRHDADERDESREHVRPPAVADEVVVRVAKDLDHMEIVSTFRRPM